MSIEKQKAQVLGRNSESVEVETLDNESRLPFPQVSNLLLDSTIIGIEVSTGTGTSKSPRKNKVLLTAAEISTGRIHLEDCNRQVIDLPLRLFITAGKPLMYVPIDPIRKLNASQCYLYFAEQFPANTNKVVEINFITE